MAALRMRCAPSSPPVASASVGASKSATTTTTDPAPGRGARPAAPEFLAVGRIGRAHGIGGEVRVQVLTDFPDRRFAAGAVVILGQSGATPDLEAVIESTRPGKGTFLVRFDLASDRDSARRLTGYTVFIPTRDAAELAAGEYFEHQLVGLEVTLEDGDIVGRVASLMETGAADVLVIAGPEGDRLVPMTEEVVRDIDLDGGRMVIRPLPGLLD